MQLIRRRRTRRAGRCGRRRLPSRRAVRHCVTTRAPTRAPTPAPSRACDRLVHLREARLQGLDLRAVDPDETARQRRPTGPAPDLGCLPRGAAARELGPQRVTARIGPGRGQEGHVRCRPFQPQAAAAERTADGECTEQPRAPQGVPPREPASRARRRRGADGVRGRARRRHPSMMTDDAAHARQAPSTRGCPARSSSAVGSLRPGPLLRHRRAEDPGATG